MVRQGCLAGLLASPVVPTLGEREMTFEEKREIWDAILECARHAPLKAPTQLAEELISAHSRVWGDSTEEPTCSYRRRHDGLHLRDIKQNLRTRK